MDFDKDLQSIQEVRWLVAKAVVAQKELAKMSQQQVDGIAKAIADACAAQSERLAKMAVEETGFGIWQDKVLKNLLGSAITWDSVKDMKTVGIIKDDRQNGLMEVGVPMGVVAALIPSTNPTSTTMYKSIISIKAGNAIVISPHPNAKNCIIETAKVICEAARKAGAPEGIVQCITLPTMEATDALLKNRNIGIILATGGEAMVRAAYSSGNPALGVGRATVLLLLKSQRISLWLSSVLWTVRHLIMVRSVHQSRVLLRSAALSRRWWMKSAVRAVTL